MENEQFYAAMSYHTGASACGQRCAVPQRNKSAPRTRSELQKQYGKCVLSGNYCTLCEARPVYVRTYVRTYVRMYVCTYVRMYVGTYVRTYMQSHAVIIHRFSGWSIHGRVD